MIHRGMKSQTTTLTESPLSKMRRGTERICRFSRQLILNDDLGAFALGAHRGGESHGDRGRMHHPQFGHGRRARRWKNRVSSVTRERDGGQSALGDDARKRTRAHSSADHGGGIEGQRRRCIHFDFAGLENARGVFDLSARGGQARMFVRRESPRRSPDLALIESDRVIQAVTTQGPNEPDQRESERATSARVCQPATIAMYPRAATTLLYKRGEMVSWCARCELTCSRQGPGGDGAILARSCIPLGKRCAGELDWRLVWWEDASGSKQRSWVPGPARAHATLVDGGRCEAENLATRQAGSQIAPAVGAIPGGPRSVVTRCYCLRFRRGRKPL
jgi:hypothetical protein